MWFCDERCEVCHSVNIILQSTWPQLSRATDSQYKIYSPNVYTHSWKLLFYFMRKTSNFALVNDYTIHAWCVDEENLEVVLSCVAWPLPPRSDSSPLRYLPPRQPRHGNRSLFKSFMSTPQKRRACRKLRDRNEECVIVPLICDDLWHNGCNWFDNHSLFPLRREES